MRNAFSRLWNDKRGNVLVLAAAALPMLAGAAGLATDTIQWALWKRELQRAADSAALAGVYERINTAAYATSGVDAAVTRDLALNQRTGIALNGGYPLITFPADTSTEKYKVKVVLKIQKTLPFSAMFMQATPNISASAVAANIPSDEYCVVSLENSASKAGITIGGSAKIEMDCGMISNSPASNSALSNGVGSTVIASVIAAVGGVAASKNWNVPKYTPYTAPIVDPYADVNIDRTQMNCFKSGSNYPKLGATTSGNLNGANATVTLAAARAAQPNANCFRGLSVGVGETVNLPAGTYYIGEGGADIQGTVTGTDVTLVLTNIDATKAVGTLKVNANDGSLNISAPTAEGAPYRGIAVYQDRNATDGPGINNMVNGNSASNVVGALYFPKQELTYNGNGSSAFVCTRLVGRRVIFSGNAAVTNKFEKGSNCPGLGAIQGGGKVRLIG